MDDKLWAVILGAIIASVVPLLTLRINQTQWRLEKRLDLLRRKRDDLARIYSEILEPLSTALADRSHPINMISKISVHASEEVRKLYYDHMDAPSQEPGEIKGLLLDISIAAERHLSSVDKEIESLLK